MTPDIVERLRAQGRWVTTKRVPLIPQLDEEEWLSDPLSVEAADEIERLRNELNLITEHRWTQTEIDAIKWRAHQLARELRCIGGAGTDPCPCDDEAGVGTPASNPESVQLAVTHYEDDRSTFDVIHVPEGYVHPELEALVAEAIKRYPNQDAPSWLSPIAAILVVEQWLIERGGVS